jgi:hypothetical protein
VFFQNISGYITRSSQRSIKKGPVVPEMVIDIMLRIQLESVLIAILLIAAIVLVIFLIILVARLIGTVGRVNVILDDSTNAVTEVKQQITGMIADIRSKGSKVTRTAGTSVNSVKNVINKVPFKRK